MSVQARSLANNPILNVAVDHAFDELVPNHQTVTISDTRPHCVRPKISLCSHHDIHTTTILFVCKDAYAHIASGHVNVQFR
jgi:hypothetical protein